MRELLTKSFWQGVKKTYQEALEAPPAPDSAPPVPTEDGLNASSTPESPAPPPATEPL